MTATPATNGCSACYTALPAMAADISGITGPEAEDGGTTSFSQVGRSGLV